MLRFSLVRDCLFMVRIGANNIMRTIRIIDQLLLKWRGGLVWWEELRLFVFFAGCDLVWIHVWREW